MGQDVHGQRRHGHIDLTACRALAGHLAVQAPMSLLVAAQVRWCGIGLATLIARVSGPCIFHVYTFPCLFGLASSAGAPVWDVEAVCRVAITLAFWFSTVVPVCRQARLRAVWLLEVWLTILLSSTADRSIEWVRYSRAELLLTLIFWRIDVVLDVACNTKIRDQSHTFIINLIWLCIGHEIRAWVQEYNKADLFWFHVHYI